VLVSSKTNRIIAVAALVTAAVAFLVTPTVGAQTTPAAGSLAATGDGGVEVNFSGAAEDYYVFLYEEGESCQVGTTASPITAVNTPLYSLLGSDFGPTPITIEVGTEVFSPGQGRVPAPAGTFQFCLLQYYQDGPNGTEYLSIAGLSAELFEAPTPTPTTTSTTVAPTTTTVAPTTTSTTAPAAAPAAPRFTG
jgi:hypothetical protein